MAGGDLEAAVRQAAAAGGSCAGTDGVDTTASRGRVVAGGGVPARQIRLQERARRQPAAGQGPEEEEEDGKRRVMAARASDTSAWKVAAILLARSYKSGYAK